MLASSGVRWVGGNPVLAPGVSLVFSLPVCCGTWPAWVTLGGHLQLLSKEHCLDFCTKASLMNNKNFSKPIVLSFISLCTDRRRVLPASPLPQEKVHPKTSLGIWGWVTGFRFPVSCCHLATCMSRQALVKLRRSCRLKRLPRANAMPEVRQQPRVATPGPCAAAAIWLQCWLAFHVPFVFVPRFISNNKNVF